MRKREFALQEFIKRLGENVHYMVSDVAKYKKLEGLVCEIDTILEDINILVNNDSINMKKHAFDTTDEEFNLIVHANSNAVFSLLVTLAG